jgi:hypothetical protein
VLSEERVGEERGEGGGGEVLSEERVGGERR